MGASSFYIREEAKKGFKGWTKEGLEFLLHRGDLEEEIERECKKALARLSKKNHYKSICSNIIRLLQNLCNAI
ncbi:MAG: hypothetical protein AB7D38_10510 [Sulfurimonas sp.]|jgi:hypothetical protein|uniref:hypothetical protein n=1 Tax=Sulfurimonas sp. TaxID=2022749 RepID=UPI0023EFD706|nr:hypothetical protein [Sulfurimonas denitrificans]